MAKAATNHIKSDSEMNLRRSIGVITGKCLPNLSKRDIEKDESTRELFEELIEKLDAYNENGRYHDDIKKLKARFKQASERELPAKRRVVAQPD